LNKKKQLEEPEDMLNLVLKFLEQTYDEERPKLKAKIRKDMRGQ